MTFSDDQYEQRGFLQKYGFPLGIGAVGLVVIGLIVGQMMTGKKEAPRRQQEVVMIRSIPAPPSPPQPKLPEPPKQTVDQMIKQDTISPDEDKPDDSPAEAPGITTSLVGSGGADFGLKAARPGGDLLGGSGSKGPSSPFGWYGRKVIKSVQDALSRNRLTSRAQFSDKEVRIWTDISGRITRTKLKGTTGDKAVDQAINDALVGLQLEEPPPAGMPLPIVMKLKALRP
jgi:periplasmic protein TonB